ncbi:MAG: winged helix-turn-helix transcriptional regulator [Candidatus Jordarchaeales archaeon]
MKVEDLEEAFRHILGMKESTLRVLTYILVKGERVTPKEIVEETGLSQNSVWKAVRRLEALGVIRSVERGSYEANHGFILALLLFELQKVARMLGEVGVERD